MDLDLINATGSTGNNEVVQGIVDAVGQFQENFNTLDQKLADAVAPPSAPAPNASLTKNIPAKIFDPIYGPNVIFGFVISSDFTAFCSYNPISRVGDLVFVVGYVGPNIVAEVGFINTGCMNARNNSKNGGGTPDSIFSAYCGGPKIKLYDANVNADFLNPVITKLIDGCFQSGDLTVCMPIVIDTILSSCANNDVGPTITATNSFNLEKQIQKIGFDNVAKLNEKLKSGFCGSTPIENVKYESDRILKMLNRDKSGNGICDGDGSNNSILGPMFATRPNADSNGPNPSCMSEYMKYINLRLQENLEGNGQVFDGEIGDLISTEDATIAALIADIKNQFENEIKDNALRLQNSIPDNFPSNLEEAYNLALDIVDDFIGKENQSISPQDTIARLKEIRDKLTRVIDNPVDSIQDWLINDPDMQRFFKETMEQRDVALNSLIPPPPAQSVICADPQPENECSDKVELQKSINDSIASLIEKINGKPDSDGIARGANIGLIAGAMSDAGIKDLKQATGAAGMNPIDSLTLYKSKTNSDIDDSKRQTASVKAYLEYTSATSMNLADLWTTFQGVFSSQPRDMAGNANGAPAALTPLLAAIQAQCVTLPQQAIEQFALDSAALGNDIRNFSFSAMAPDEVGTSPSLAQMLSNPSVLIPSSNIGMILSSSASAIVQAVINSKLCVEQISTIIIPKEEMLDMMTAYATNVVQMGIDALKSLQGCIPKLPCIQFNGLFNMDFYFKLGIGLPFKINIPVIGLTIPPLNINIPIRLPTLVTPTGFKAALNIGIPSFRFPRIPQPPVFPPNFNLRPIPLPRFRIPLDLSKLFGLIPKIPRFVFNIPLPKITLPKLKSIVIPPIKIRLPKFAVYLGAFPLPKLDIKLPKFPIDFSIKVPLSFNLRVPIPSISLKLPNIPRLPNYKLPNLILNIPKINVPFTGGLEFGSPQLPKLSIPFPAITIPSMCSDNGQSIDSLIADGKNFANRIFNMGAGGGRPMAVANCSMWTSPHFHGWIAPVPCVGFATDLSNCVCMS